MSSGIVSLQYARAIRKERKPFMGKTGLCLKSHSDSESVHRTCTVLSAMTPQCTALCKDKKMTVAQLSCVCQTLNLLFKAESVP